MYDSSTIDLPDNYILKNNSIPEIAFSSQHYWSELRAYYEVPEKGALSDAQAKQMILGYRVATTYADAMIGRILDALRNTGLDKNTIVILLGDHGWNLGEHGIWCKHANFNTSLNAPLIISGPNIPKNKKVNEIVEFIDIYPTICDLTKTEIPESVEGQSLVELMKGNHKDWKNYAVCKYQYGTTLIVGQTFYTEYNDKQGGIKGIMLFDHATDPDENENIAPLKDNVQLVQKLSTQLKQLRGFDY